MNDMYNNNDESGFLTVKQRYAILNLLKQKELSRQAINDFLHMDYEEMLGFYELYLADSECDLDIFCMIFNDNQYMDGDVGTNAQSYSQSPCETKQCICYDKANNFCKSYCMDVSGLKLYDVMNCRGDEAYLQQGFAAMRERDL